MPMSMPIRFPLIAVLFGALFALFTPNLASAQLSGTLSGPRFVETAGIAGMFEIESSKIALKRSDNVEIRKFAEMMVTDHTKIAASLKRATEDANGEIKLPAVLDADHESMIKKLNAASTGREFDTLYIQMQLQGHQEAVSLFSAFAKDGDQTALKTFATETLPILQGHLDHVKKLEVKT